MCNPLTHKCRSMLFNFANRSNHWSLNHHHHHRPLVLQLACSWRRFPDDYYAVQKLSSTFTFSKSNDNLIPVVSLLATKQQTRVVLVFSPLKGTPRTKHFEAAREILWRRPLAAPGKICLWVYWRRSLVARQRVTRLLPGWEFLRAQQVVLAFPGRRAQCPVHLGQVSIRIRMSNRSSIMDHSLSLSLSILSCAGVDGTKYTWSTFGCGWICSCPCSHSLSQAG